MPNIGTEAERQAALPVCPSGVKPWDHPPLSHPVKGEVIHQLPGGVGKPALS